MRHFDRDELVLYTRGLAEENINLLIEEHLLTCDECLELYMEVVEDISINDTSSLISRGFCDKVMDVVKEVNENKSLRNEGRGRKTSEILLYYTAAACITLVFMAGGVFQQLSGSVSSITSSIAGSPKSMEKVVSNGWSERLVNSTSIMLDELWDKNYRD